MVLVILKTVGLILEVLLLCVLLLGWWLFARGRASSQAFEKRSFLLLCFHFHCHRVIIKHSCT